MNIDEILVVTPVDNVETADSGGGEQIKLRRVLENTRTFGCDQLQNYILQLQSGILSLRREIIELRNEFERRFDVRSQLIERGFATVNGNFRRVAMQPVQHSVATTNHRDSTILCTRSTTVQVQY